jgi:DNA-directed RNA polymerase specialized sigma24 family protein
MASIGFTTEEQVIEALSVLPAQYDPRTSSLLRVRKGQGDPNATLFRPGFLAGFEERAELMRRLRLLDARSRTLLLLWFVEGHPVAHIAAWLGISRVHCYRLKKAALRAMLDEGDAPANGATDDRVGSAACAGVGLRTPASVDR